MCWKNPYLELNPVRPRISTDEPRGVNSPRLLGVTEGPDGRWERDPLCGSHRPQGRCGVRSGARCRRSSILQIPSGQCALLEKPGLKGPAELELPSYNCPKSLTRNFFVFVFHSSLMKTASERNEHLTSASCVPGLFP